MKNRTSMTPSTQEILRAFPAQFCWAFLALGLAFSCSVSSTHATDYVFDVDYFGDDNASLAPGSDDPLTTTLVDGDSFEWTIAAQDGDFWRVEEGGSFFPLMSFSAGPAGSREGSFTLVLVNDGVDVFSFDDTVINKSVHIGTNTINLLTGLVFDEMYLDYLLLEALEDDDPDGPDGPIEPIDPDDLLPISTTLSGLLPIFGAPENNQHSPGIVYGVPEPATLALGLLSAVGLVACARQKKS